MLVLSHRGFKRAHPENSLDAFAGALAYSVDGFETDVRISRDGLPVLYHDRVAPSGREVALLTRDELSQDVGFPVPTLDEALSRFPEVFWNVELKVPEAQGITMELLKRHLSRGDRRALLTSFHHPVVAELSRDPELKCGILIAHRPITVASLLSGLPSNITTVVWDYEIVDAAALNDVTERGIANFVYGARTEMEHSRLTDLRVDGIITDFPDTLQISAR